MAREIRERFILTRLYRDERKVKILFLVILGLVFALVTNIAYLNLVSFNNLKAESLGGNLLTSPTPTSVPIKEPTPTPVVVQTEIYRDSNQNNGPKEYFIAFGSGSGSSGDWEDVSGLEAVIDFGNYQNIKEIKFETSVSVPTGNESVSVRLYNKTDKHPVWNSELNTPGGTNATYLAWQP